MTGRRRQVSQQPPDPARDVHRFPSRTLRAGAIWFRQHAQSDGPWWFSSTGDGRFDLPPPRGTCYLASNAPAAIRERVGPDFAAHGSIPSSLLDGRVVSTLALPQQVRAANLNATKAADHGVTRELPVMVPYDVPRAWAAAFAAAAYDGIVAELRFTPGRPSGLALFGDAGEHSDWPDDRVAVPARTIATRMGLRAVEAPHASQVTVMAPPDGQSGHHDY